MLSAAADGILYATLACPYAHRALLALALRPVPGIEVRLGVPTLNQLNYLDNLGTGNLGGDPLSSFSSESVAELHTRKDQYKRDVIASGETPALQLAGSSGVVYESEIVCEFLDAASTADGPHRLVPADPLLASRVRISMKKFNSVPLAIVKLLKNQEPSEDAALAKSLDSVLAAFVATLEASLTGSGGAGGAGSAQFCHGGECSLADVHVGPFLFRFDAVLRHYRNYVSGECMYIAS
jgi:glutathione S-transferase